MSTTYKECTLKEIQSPDGYGSVDGPFGSNLPASSYTEKGTPVIRGVNLSLGKERFKDFNYVYVGEETAIRLNRSSCQPGDIVFTKKGTLGSTGLVPANGKYKKFILSSNQMRLRLNLKLADPLYVYYFVSSPYSQKRILADAMTAGVPKINLGYLRNFKILLPEPRIQRKISAILSAYDDLIENNKRRIALLENIAEEIYLEWFVRFRFPGYQTAEFEKGIPKGWGLKTFRELISYYIGGGWGEENESPNFTEGAFVIRGTDISALSNGDYSNRVFRYHKPSNLKSRKLEKNDFIFEVSGGSKDQLLGRNIMVTEGLLSLFDNKVMCASFCKQMRFNPEIVSPFFMKYYMKLYYDCDLVGIYQVQSTGISNYQFESFLNYQTIAIPPSDIMKQFEAMVEPLIQQQEVLAFKNLNLKQAKESLLPRLISGKLSVEDLDIQFPSSMQEENAA